jgi:hypothetical protein
MRVLEHLEPAQVALRDRMEAVVESVSPMERALKLDRDKQFDISSRWSRSLRPSPPRRGSTPG